MRVQKAVIKTPWRFTPIGHRGAGGELPGNTLESFDRLVAVFPNGMLEMDVWETRDGEIAVYHDMDLRHETDASGPVINYSYDELKEADRGYNVTLDQGSTFPFRGKGYRIPLLGVVITRHPGSTFAIDIKYHKREFALKVVENIIRLGALERTIITSFNASILSAVRKKYPSIATSFTRGEIVTAWLLKIPFRTMGPMLKGDALMVPEFTGKGKSEYLGGEERQDIRVVTPGLIRRAHAMGIPVFPWTINIRENMRRLIEWGVDGIVTDFPSVLKEVMDEFGLGSGNQNI